MAFYSARKKIDSVKIWNASDLVRIFVEICFFETHSFSWILVPPYGCTFHLFAMNWRRWRHKGFVVFNWILWPMVKRLRLIVSVLGRWLSKSRTHLRSRESFNPFHELTPIFCLDWTQRSENCMHGGQSSHSFSPSHVINANEVKVNQLPRSLRDFRVQRRRDQTSKILHYYLLQLQTSISHARAETLRKSLGLSTSVALECHRAVLLQSDIKDMVLFIF